MNKLPAIRMDEPEILSLSPNARSAGALTALLASGACADDLEPGQENVTIFIEVTIPLIRWGFKSALQGH